MTRAGEKIGLSQPATSAALARLRRHFGDELLERVGSQYQLRTVAMSLLEQSGTALRYVEQTFAARPLFDAKESDRQFTVVASDYALIVLGAGLGGLLQERAPDVQLRIRPMDRASVDDARNALRTVDVLLLPQGYLSDLPGRPLFEDDWVVVARRRRSPQLRTLSADDLRSARWVMTFDGPIQFTPPDKTLRLLGLDRRADIFVENFASIPALIAGSDRFALLPRRIAQRLAPVEDVELLETPVQLPVLVETM